MSTILSNSDYRYRVDTVVQGLKYDIGAERQVCSNGMTAFISELSFDQTHSELFQPGLAYNAVGAVDN